MAKDVYPVWFNNDQKEMFEQLQSKGLTSRKKLAEFVKDAFYDAIDKLNIEKITQERIQAITSQSN